MAKKYAIKFYKSKAWQECRASYINSVNGLCERCLKQGEYKPGKIVHHINYITKSNINDPYVTLNWENLEFCCIDCHNLEHHGSSVAIRNDVMFDDEGNLIQR